VGPEFPVWMNVVTWIVLAGTGVLVLWMAWLVVCLADPGRWRRRRKYADSGTRMRGLYCQVRDG
jgi:hypothetical protein